jgi:manganese/zinc/iron transport system permease protein
MNADRLVCSRSRAIILRLLAALIAVGLAFSASPVFAADAGPAARRSTVDQLIRVLTLRDYNTRVVLTGTTLLGISGGLAGVFLLLRRRSLTADVISHSSFPGIAIAFLAAEVIEAGSGKSTVILLSGAFLSGLAGIGCTTLILRYTRIKEDAALAIVLSTFFGLGIALFTIVQKIPTGNAAGLEHFIYGKAASMIAADVWLIFWGSLAVIVLFVLLFKEWTLVSFDDQFAAAEGWPVLGLDLLLVTVVAVITVVGLQSVGVLLVVALMIIPAVAARFWTDELKPMAIISAAVGAASSILGVLTSAMFPRLAAGAVIVLAGSALFLISMLFGTRHGVVHRTISHYMRDRRIARDHLLRALFECIESRSRAADDIIDHLTQYSVGMQELLRHRTWVVGRLRRLIRSAERQGLVVDYGQAGIKLTEEGAEEACRVVRKHRLWELYLIEFADRSPSRVDRDADDIEHDLGHEIVRQLERMLAERYPRMGIPPSPHALDSAVVTGGVR